MSLTSVTSPAFSRASIPSDRICFATGYKKDVRAVEIIQRGNLQQDISDVKGRQTACPLEGRARQFRGAERDAVHLPAQRAAAFLR